MCQFRIYRLARLQLETNQCIIIVRIECNLLANIVHYMFAQPLRTRGCASAVTCWCSVHHWLEGWVTDEMCLWTPHKYSLHIVISINYSLRRNHHQNKTTYNLMNVTLPWKRRTRLLCAEAHTQKQQLALISTPLHLHKLNKQCRQPQQQSALPLLSCWNVQQSNKQTTTTTTTTRRWWFYTFIISHDVVSFARNFMVSSLTVHSNQVPEL